MNQSDFEQQLKKQGFSEVELQTLAPRHGKRRHRHHFEIRGLAISGTFVVQQSGDPVAYRPGEIFSVAEGELHDEWIQADGAIVLVGRNSLRLRRNAAARPQFTALKSVSQPAATARTINVWAIPSASDLRSPETCVPP
jgi:quercetin dioxygenase-like cupin family protein